MRKMTWTLAALWLATSAQAADWPHWLGPNRNGSSSEKGLLLDWPKAGPKVLWQVKGGEGYGTIAVAKGRAIVLVQRGGKECVLALDALKGDMLWETPIAPAYQNQYGNGPRSTPTIEGDFVYVQSATGPLACLSVATGDIVWSVDLLKTYGGKNISWGLSASPVIDGDWVLAIPGAKGAAVAALEKKTGKLVWKTGDDKAGYASPMPITVAGQKQFVFFTATGLSAVTAEGKEAWRLPWETEFGCNICTPLLVGDALFVSSGENVGSALLKLSAAGAPEVVWESRGPKGVMTNYWANAVAHEGYLYGLSGEFSKKIHLNCVDLRTGKLMWSQKNFGKGAICLVEGHLVMTTKTGDVVLVSANPKQYTEKARFSLLGDNRTAPTLANGLLYLRDKESVFCLNLSK